MDITSSLGEAQQGLDQLQFVDVVQHGLGLLGAGSLLQNSGGGESSPGEGDNLKYQT